MEKEGASPKPEELQPASAGSSTIQEPSLKTGMKSRRVAYRPSKRATLLGLGVVIAILAVVSGGLFFLIRGQGGLQAALFGDQVTISQGALESLGVSKNQVSTQGAELVVGPNARFNGKVRLGGDVSIAGQLQLNNALSASSANLATLQAGTVTLGQFNASGDGTVGTLNARNDLNIAGTTRLQGPVNVAQLLSVNNNLNVAGNVAIGGSLSVRTFQASSLTSDTTLTIGGHVITRGSAPSVGAGGGVGSNGTVSISGNDASGTVAVNTGVGAGNGIVAQVSFRQAYATTPHVVVTPIGIGVKFYVNRNPSGFTIGVSEALPPGGFAFDYIVMQ
ncbi:MAG: hypothetical protein ABIQ64_04150 [Candidatus Saccharimonadales bacterium]